MDEEIEKLEEIESGREYMTDCNLERLEEEVHE
jgi:hypothetical protein